MNEMPESGNGKLNCFGNSLRCRSLRKHWFLGLIKKIFALLERCDEKEKCLTENRKSTYSFFFSITVWIVMSVNLIALTVVCKKYLK